MIIPNNLRRGFELYQEEYEAKAVEVLRSGWYVLGKEVASFEKEWAEYNGAKYCVGLASGLDALWLVFRVLGIGPGDEVIVPGNTYIASVMGITINGALPVFVEPDAYYGISAEQIEEKVTERTKAVLAVHLYGIPSDMERIAELCRKYRLRLVEDCAQSHGASYKGKMTGTFGDAGCFSFYPTKNLGAFGDGGCVITNDSLIDKNLRIYRNYGSQKRYYNKVEGANSRLDEIQAGLLRVKLSHLDELIEGRRKLASRYAQGIQNPKIIKPEQRPGTACVWHQYVIRCRERERLAGYLEELGIGTLIHYPVPPYLSEAYSYLGHKKGLLPVTEKYAGEVLSVPIYDGMSVKEQDYVIHALNAF